MQTRKASASGAQTFATRSSQSAVRRSPDCIWLLLDLLAIYSVIIVEVGPMVRPATEIRLSTEEKEILLRLTRSSKTEQHVVERARVILLASNGLSGKEIALKMGT